MRPLVIKMLKVACSLLFVAAVTAVRYDGYHIITAGPLETQHDVSVVQSLIDESYEDRQVMMLKWPGDLMVAPNQVARVLGVLSSYGINYNVVEKDFQAHHEEVMKINELNKQRCRRRYDLEIGPFFDYSYYMELDELTEYTHTLVDDSSIASISSIGETYNGLDMELVTINGGTSLPAIWLDSAIHAREWITPVTNMYIMEQILTGTDDDSVRMRTNYRWYFLISANPDGYEYSWTDDRMFRKTRSPNVDSDCVGTDPNRNFGYEWESGGASDDPCADDYRGTDAFSEIESRNLRDAVTANRDGMIAYVCLHAYSQMWLHSWGYTEERPVDYPDMLRNSDEAVAAIEAVHGRVFQVGSTPDLLWPVSGQSSDWVYGDQGVVYAYSPELRPDSAEEGGVDPDPIHILPSGEETYAGIIAMVDDIAENM